MKLKKSIKIVKPFQTWRLGKPPYENGGEKLLYTAKQLTSALEMLISCAEKGDVEDKKSISNTEILCFILGWQGGTVHQVAKTLGVDTHAILCGDYEAMQTLMRLAQNKRNLKDKEI